MGGLDFETGDTTFGIQVIVSGITGTPASEELTVTLTNVNDTPPVIDDLTTPLQITENRTFSEGNILTTLKGSADVAGATLTWSLEENVPADSGLSLPLILQQVQSHLPQIAVLILNNMRRLASW